MRRYELTDAQWRQVGWIDRLLLLQALPIRLDAAGHIDWDLWCVDGSSVRAHGSAVGGGKKRGVRKNRRITHWAAAAAVGAPQSRWWLTVQAPR